MTTHSDDLGELAAALARAQAELEPAPKDAKGQVGKQEKFYADLASCWDACQRVLPKHGLAVVQTPRSEGDADYLDTTLIHASGQWMRGSTRLLWGDNPALTPMQCYGSALTYARRYGLSAIVGLTTKDDDAAGAGTPARTSYARPAQSRPSMVQALRDDAAGRSAPAREPGADDDLPSQAHGVATDDGGDYDPPPRSGSALFAWCREQEKAHGDGLIRHLNGFGKKHGLPPRMVDFDADQIGMTYAEARRVLSQLRMPAMN